MRDNKTQSNDHKTYDSARDWYDYEPPDWRTTDENGIPVVDDCPADNQRETAYATLIFALDDPEGERQLRECLDAPRVESVLWDLVYEPVHGIRNVIKYTLVDADDDDSQKSTLRWVLDRINELCSSNGVNLED